MSIWLAGRLHSTVNAFVITVVTGLVIAALRWIAVHAPRLWQKLRLWRLSLGMRRAWRESLREHFEGVYSRRRVWLGRRAIRRLAGSFRVAVDSRGGPPREALKRKSKDAVALLRYVQDQGGGSVHLINAETGDGKTVFGLTLTLLLRRITREGLVPLYLDLGDVDPDRPLVELERILDRLGGERKPWGRPLFVFDSLDETVSPEYFAEALAGRREELHTLGGQLLFLFSLRHHSYPARLRLALLEQGFDQIDNAELLFDIDGKGDLDFLLQLAGSGGSQLGGDQLRSELRAHAARSPLISLSRQDVRRYLSRRRSNGRRQACPSPADLCVAEILGEQPVAAESLAPLAEVSFLLLGRERRAATYRHIAEKAGLDRGTLESAAAAHPHIPVCCKARHFRVESEAAIRVLGALEVGRRLLDGSSPEELKGRTIYDACAPYVPAVLSWLAKDDPAGLSLDRLAEPVRAAVKGRQAPYSFYATVLCSDDGGVLGNRDGSLDHTLFEQMISAIDVDRLQTCSDSLRAAGAQEPELLLDPVLDQLFEVMAAYGDRAVSLLLGILGSREPLIRSQAAYLLLGWIRRASRKPSDGSRGLLDLIPARMSVDDGNLHFRFHQVEILESLQSALPAGQTEAHRRVVWLLGEIGAEAGDSIDLIDGYSEFQRLVSLHARTLAESMPPERVAAVREQLERCISLLPTDERFWESDEKAAVEACLECWEVCLGMAVRMCNLVRQNLAYATFVERALDHDLWIVRWWAFSGVVGLVVATAEAGEGTLARRWAARAVRQVQDGVEPIGVKHRQCAMIRELRDEEGAAARFLQEALLAVPAPTATDPARQKLGERYYKAMGSSPDAYLEEFFRRLDGIAGAPVGSAIGRS
jgi:hypothetical protein